MMGRLVVWVVVSMWTLGSFPIVIDAFFLISFESCRYRLCFRGLDVICDVGFCSIFIFKFRQFEFSENSDGECHCFSSVFFCVRL